MTDAELIAMLSKDQVAFTQQCFHTVSPAHEYLHNWHIDCIIEHLQAVESGELPRLIINMPPRMLKSICVSIAWPAWLLGKDPTIQIMVASYVQDLAKAQSIDCRMIIESAWYQKCFPHTVIARDQNEKHKFKTTRQGHRMAYSVGSARIGQGADYLILDDPIDPEGVLSPAITTSTNHWISNSFLTRENNPKTSKGVLVMQRLDTKDPTAYLQEKGWYSLILPAYMEKRTVITVNNKSWICEQDSYLQENRLGEDELDLKLVEMGMQGFVGQYLQRPSPEGGGEFQDRYVQYYDNFSRKFTSKGMNVYILYDPANTKKNKERIDPDYTAMVVVGLAPDNNYYILDIVRDRFNLTERVNKLIELHQKWSKLSGKPPIVGIEQYGMMVEKECIDNEMVERNYRFRTVPMKGSVKKEDRIRKLVRLFENNRVYLPKQIMYDSIDGNCYELTMIFVKEELTVFPVGRHDDMLDAFARILDPELEARFPKIGVVYLEGGQTLKEYYAEDFKSDDIMTW